MTTVTIKQLELAVAEQAREEGWIVARPRLGASGGGSW
jgi:NADPH-dependent glutamate synthase beta subunit-like oxidoreductase